MPRARSLADEGRIQWTLQGTRGSTLILVFLEARASRFLFPRISNGSCGFNSVVLILPSLPRSLLEVDGNLEPATEIVVTLM